MKAIVLAGGEGTRLRPLTFDTPKPLIPIHGQTLTECVFDVLKVIGVTEVILSLSYQAEKIRAYFNQKPYPGFKLGYLIEEKLMGTAGPLMLLKRQGKIIGENFVVVNGDNLFNFDYAAWLRLHQQLQAVATIALKPIDDVVSRGVAAMDGDKIKAFIEKPTAEEAPSNLINSGYYFFSPAIFDYIDITKDFLMLESDVFPRLASEGKLFGFVGDGQWFDTGTFERYERVKKEWKGPSR